MIEEGQELVRQISKVHLHRMQENICAQAGVDCKLGNLAFFYQQIMMCIYVNALILLTVNEVNR